MNGLEVERQDAGDVAASDATTRSPDSWLRVACVDWIMLVVTILGLAVIGLPGYRARRTEHEMTDEG